MPTPQQYANQSSAIKPIQGLVPGMTWAQFTQQFGAPSNASQVFGGANVSGLGAVTTNRSTGLTPGSWGSAESGSSGMGTGTYNGGWNSYAQPVGDGTENVFLQDPNGGDGVFSQNQTINSDSWWDSTGLPLVASLAFGGATAGLAAAGIGVDGVTGAAIGSASAGLPGATSTGLNASGNAVASGAGGINDIASANYNPYSPSNWTADAGGVASDATNAATQQPSLWDQALNTAKEYGFGNGPVGSVQNIFNGTGQIGDYLSAGSNLNTVAGLANDVSGSSSDTTNPFQSVVNQYAQTNGTGYTPPTIDTSYINNGIQTPNIVQNPNGSYSDTVNYGSGSSSGGGLLGSIANLYNNGITSGSAQDYSNILGGAGSLLNGVLGYTNAQNGINAQTNAANQNNALAAAIYANNTALAKPFVDGGTAAFNQQSNLNGLNGTAAQTAAQGQFKTDPGYQFALDQGNRGVQSSAAAQGGLYSGRAAKDLTNYNQGMADQQYGAYYNRLSGQAGIGQAAAAGQAAQGNNYVNNVTSNNSAIGNAQTVGGTAGTNAITGSINGLLNQNSNNQLLNLLLKNQGNSGYYGG